MARTPGLSRNAAERRLSLLEKQISAPFQQFKSFQRLLALYKHTFFSSGLFKTRVSGSVRTFLLTRSSWQLPDFPHSKSFQRSAESAAAQKAASSLDVKVLMWRQRNYSYCSVIRCSCKSLRTGVFGTTVKTFAAWKAGGRVLSCFLLLSLKVAFKRGLGDERRRPAEIMEARYGG